MTWLERLRRLRLDVRPWRTSRDYRLLLTAGTVFYLGGMMTYVAVPFQVYGLTKSNLMVGAVGLAELVPLVVFGLWGGAMADHFDRRKVLVASGGAQVVLTGVLAVNAFRDRPSLPVIFVVAGLLAAAGAVQRPSRDALVPRTVAYDLIPAAAALMGFATSFAFIAGPAIGGLLAAGPGVAWCFVADTAGLLVATGLFALLRSYPHEHDTTPPSLSAIGEGLRYAVSRRDLLGTYCVDLACMFLALPVTLFPALAETIYRRPDLLGALYAAETIGAGLAAATSGWIARVHHQGRAIVIAAAAYGLFVAGAGLAPTIWGTIGLLAFAGAADEVSALFRQIVWNQTIPDRIRGRLAGIEMLSYSVGPLLGQVRSGVVADQFGVRRAVVSGGASCIVGVGLVAVWLREFWGYDRRTDPHAVAERAARSATDSAVDSDTDRQAPTL